MIFSTATLLILCGFCLEAAAQQRRAGAPLDLRPRVTTPPEAAPREADILAAPPVATPSTLIPGLPPISRSVMPYRGREKIRLNSDVIARRVFTANAVNGKGSGFFLLTPDGVIRPLAVTPEKMRRVFFKTEVQRLALPLRKRQRMIRIASERGKGSRHARQLRGAAGDTDRARPLSDFFSDTSLKAGDVVVTSRGLQVFRGTDAFPYTARHFTPLAQWRRANGGGGRLEGIERQLRRGR